MRWKQVEFGIESLLWLAATLCFAILLGAWVMHVQAAHTAFAMMATGGNQSATGQGDMPGSNQGHAAPARVTRPGDVIGTVEIPKLGLSVPMTAGIETNSLLRGVGHIDGTAFPGGLGTLGLAGHRDTYFRPLRHIQNGMDIRVSDASGTYHYTVDSTEIVTPEQVEVLSIRDRPELTLITCYPFDYVGAAPKRFIVHASLLSASPDKRP